jgi:hypothetical protein
VQEVWRDTRAEVGADDEADKRERGKDKAAPEAPQRRHDHDRDRNPVDEVERHPASVDARPVETGLHWAVPGA